MNKKGFTLIELLSVIVILALLVLMVIPTITKLMNNSKKEAFTLEAENIIKVAENVYAEEVLNKVNIKNCYTITELAPKTDKNLTNYTGSVLIDTLSANHRIWLSNKQYIVKESNNYKNKIIVLENDSNTNASITCGGIDE